MHDAQVLTLEKGGKKKEKKIKRRIIEIKEINKR